MKKQLIFLFLYLFVTFSLQSQTKVIANCGFDDINNLDQDCDGIKVGIKFENGEIIPGLEQYLIHLQDCPDMILILEINQTYADITKTGIETLTKLIDQYKLNKRIQYIIPDIAISKELRKKDRNALIGYSQNDISPIQLKEMGIEGMAFLFSAFSHDPDLINEIHRQGLFANARDVNDPVLMMRLVSMEPDYITTDHPLLLQQTIKEYTEKYTSVDYPQVDLSTFKKDKRGNIILFDGTSLDGWRGYGRMHPTEKWIIEDGTLKLDPTLEGTGGVILFAHKFKNFELELEWKISEAGNSGVFYLIQEIPHENAAASAPEAQLLDNERHPDARQGTDGNRQAASLYDLIPAKPQNAKPAGQWNRLKVRVDNGKVAHFQNGKKVVEYTLWTPQWITMLENSKFSIGEWTEAFYLMANCGGVNREGYIGFQDHGDAVWFRDIKIKIIN